MREAAITGARPPDDSDGPYPLDSCCRVAMPRSGRIDAQGRSATFMDVPPCLSKEVSDGGAGLRA
jgi:hypothetical protein